MNYAEWEKTVPMEIKADVLWKINAYRFSLLLCDLGWYDVTNLIKDKRTMSLSDQLYRALGSICANIEEGYSRGSNRDRVRFYEYALGSARESRGWYYRGREILKDIVVQHRLGLLTHIIRLLLTMIPQQRAYKIQDVWLPYEADKEVIPVHANDDLDKLFKDIPI